MTAPVLTAAQMKAADATAIESWGIPGRVLMEAAGRAAAREIEARYPVQSRRVTVVVGTGNNGGDGLVVARLLAARGARVRTVVLPGDGTPDRAANLTLLNRLAKDTDGIDLVEPDAVDWALGPSTDLFVDAVLGIGITGDLREMARAMCRGMNASEAPVVALDVPSGLDATTGHAAAATVQADLTVAFGAVKAGLLLREGPQHAGEVVVVEIGIPESELVAHAAAFRAPAGWVGGTLPTRAPDAHKYAAGRLLAVVGSRAYSGAAVLATSAGYRVGAGAVVAAIPESAAGVLDAHAPEVMVDAQPETEVGTLAAHARDAILARASRADAVLLGCGLGRATDTDALVRDLVAAIDTPLVLDADGLGAFTGDADALRERTSPLLLTPHLGEVRRLLGDPAFDPSDRIEATRSLAARWEAVVVFKGMPSLVGLPDGRVLVGPPGEPALATAGSGDTLAGSIAGLMAQGLPPAEAALCGLHLGATAARLWAAHHGALGMTASDLVDRLPRASHALRS